MKGKLHVKPQGHECEPPGSGWHRTFYYRDDGEGDHIRPGDKWECDCGKWWIAGTDKHGEHQWYWWTTPNIWLKRLFGRKS